MLGKLTSSSYGNVHETSTTTPVIRARPTGDLRWKEAILQQLFSIETYGDPRSSCPTHQREEWRDVPNVVERTSKTQSQAVEQNPSVEHKPAAAKPSGADYQPFVYGHK